MTSFGGSQRVSAHVSVWLRIRCVTGSGVVPFLPPFLPFPTVASRKHSWNDLKKNPGYGTAEWRFFQQKRQLRVAALICATHQPLSFRQRCCSNSALFQLRRFPVVFSFGKYAHYKRYTFGKTMYRAAAFRIRGQSACVVAP